MEVYIILTDTGTWFTRVIRLFTKKQLNHTSISFGKDLSEVYSFGRKRPSNPFIGGFVLEDMKGVLFENATCEVYRLSVSESQLHQMHQFVSDIEKEQCLYGYNLIGLFGILLSRGVDRERAFFCSEFVATTLGTAGVTISNKPASLTRPSEFAESPLLELIYEGTVSLYLSEHDGIEVIGLPIQLEALIQD